MVKELGAFLRARRRALGPQAAGIPSGGRRHVPGLRREEVAQLAGIGVSWYTLLEQGRVDAVSEKTLNGIARALQLSAIEHAHMLALAKRPLNGAAELPAAPPPGLLTYVTSFAGGPAFLITAYAETLAWNDAADEIFGFAALPPEERNMLLCMLRSDRLRKIFPNRQRTLRNMIGLLRMNYARIGGSDFERLIARFQAESDEFRAIWSEETVETIEGEVCEINHPRLGATSMQLLAFAPFEDIRLTLITLTPLPAKRFERA